MLRKRKLDLSLNLNNEEIAEELNFDLSIGDLMATLVLIFILVLSGTLLKLNRIFESKSTIAEKYKDLQVGLYNDLIQEFDQDLDKWGATIDKDSLSIRFNNPDILFEPNSAQIKPKFEKNINDFFPRYLKLLINDKYKDSIQEIRIEGHTAKVANDKYSYMTHVNLSQQRTNNVLELIIRKIDNSDSKEVSDWFKSKIAANGFAYSRPVFNSMGKPDYEQSRRVEFKIKTDAEKEINKLIEAGK